MTRLIALCKIIETGSFTRAADALGYTQAAVSQMIKSLEEEYGVSLIIRMRSGIRLTSEGEVLFPIIKNIVSEYNLLVERANDLFSLDDGEVKIGALPSVAQNILPHIIKRFTGKYPSIKFDIMQGDNNALSEMLRQGKVDFALMHSTEQSGMKYEHLINAEYAIIMQKGHFNNKNTLKYPDFLKSESVILTENYPTCVEFLESSGISIKYIVADTATTIGMVSEGLGVGIVPFFSFRRIDSGLEFLRINFEFPVYSIEIGSRNELPLSSAALKFTDFLKEEVICNSF